MHRVAYADSSPNGVVILAHDAYDRAERIAFPFVFRDDIFAENRFMHHDTTHLKIFKRFVVFLFRQQEELVLQFRPCYILCQLLFGTEITFSLYRTLNLPDRFIPSVVGLNREGKGGTIADRSGVKQVCVIRLTDAVQIPTALRVADGMLFPFGGLHDVLALFALEEERVLMRCEVITDRIKIGLTIRNTVGITGETFGRGGKDMGGVLYVAGHLRISCVRRNRLPTRDSLSVQLDGAGLRTECPEVDLMFHLTVTAFVGTEDRGVREIVQGWYEGHGRVTRRITLAGIIVVPCVHTRTGREQIHLYRFCGGDITGEILRCRRVRRIKRVERGVATGVQREGLRVRTHFDSNICFVLQSGDTNSVTFCFERRHGHHERLTPFGDRQ